MKIIPLSNNSVALVDGKDFKNLSMYKWYALKSTYTSYAVRWSSRKAGKRRLIYMHREILGCTGKEKGDHKNGDGLDNRRKNLRKATTEQNNQNRKKQCNNTTGFKEVSAHQGKFRTRISIKGKEYHIGVFRTAEEAHKAYCLAARKFYGEFARFE